MSDGRTFAYSGVLLSLAGVLGYFFIVFYLAAWLPSVRNDAMPNWVAIGLGLALSITAVRRAQTRRRAAWGLLAVNVGLAGLFAAFLYQMPVVPIATGPAVGVAAPDFALPDQRGQTVRLADFHGSPLLLIFYRGHW